MSGGDATRKSTGPATHSQTENNTATAHPRKLSPTSATGNHASTPMHGVNGLKTLNSGWQVWGGASSPNTTDSWPSSRPPSGNWESSSGSSAQSTQDSFQMDTQRVSSRQTSYSAASKDDRMMPKGYPRYDSSSRKVSPYGAAPGNKGYSRGDSFQPPVGDNELALAMQGMRVEDAMSHTGYPQAPAGNRLQPYPGYYSNQPNDPSAMYGSPVLANAGVNPLYSPVSSVADPRSAAFFPAQSQYFYPSPSLMYSPANVPSPISGSQLLHGDGSKESAALQMYGVGSSGFGSADYANRGMPVNVMMGPMYGGNSTQGAPAVLRYGRRPGSDQPPVTPRSPLLEEFRMNKARKWEIKDIAGHIVEFSKDQHGSRFIQTKLESSSSEDRQIVFSETVPAATLGLVQDVFGNYVIQKLFEYGSPTQRGKICGAIQGHLLQLSLQMYGCRVVQKAIDLITPDLQVTMVAELQEHVLRCVKDANGNHVIQKIIERVAPENLPFVTLFSGHVYELATHPYGCRVLQRCFQYLPDQFTRQLMDELHQHSLELMQDQFGNYVVQFVLEHGSVHDRKRIVQQLHGNLLVMARHKFASNVCEKALVCGDNDSRKVLINEMIVPANGVAPAVTMMKDQFANYVLQRALAVVEGEQREALVAVIKPQLTGMRRGQHVFIKHLHSIERMIEKYASAQPQPAAPTATA